ncbi:AAA family ATPase [Streptomyces sp. NPDC085932]|uniref:AAA family ATPase n=1 Tax=Streptomyces sp. NPDC085932 TaxID=3365741 RepID=UPI0037D95873
MLPPPNTASSAAGSAQLRTTVGAARPHPVYRRHGMRGCCPSRATWEGADGVHRWACTTGPGPIGGTSDRALLRVGTRGVCLGMGGCLHEKVRLKGLSRSGAGCRGRRGRRNARVCHTGPAHGHQGLQRPSGRGLRLPGKGGWTVIAGRNSSGKTTLLQAIAVALCGPDAAASLNVNIGGWVSDRAEAAS